jgi:hypothetical protein
MRFTIGVVFLLLVAKGPVDAQQIPNDTPAYPCDVTVLASAAEQPFPGFYGNRDLSVSLTWLGTVVFKPGGPGFVLPDGALSMKFGWQLGVRGMLTIDGRRLDASAPPLRANIPAMGVDGFQASALIFPTPGCWEVTGHVGNTSLTFVTRVIKIGDGPAVHTDSVRK